MIIVFHKEFTKGFKKLPQKIKEHVKRRLLLLENDPSAPELNAHELHGKKKGRWSINITGDWRALYVRIERNTIMFVTIDTHSNLYE